MLLKLRDWRSTIGQIALPGTIVFVPSHEDIWTGKVIGQMPQPSADEHTPWTGPVIAVASPEAVSVSMAGAPGRAAPARTKAVSYVRWVTTRRPRAPVGIAALVTGTAPEKSRGFDCTKQLPPLASRQPMLDVPSLPRV